MELTIKASFIYEQENLGQMFFEHKYQAEALATLMKIGPHFYKISPDFGVLKNNEFVAGFKTEIEAQTWAMKNQSI